MIRHGFRRLVVAPVAIFVLATDARADDPCRPVTPACVTGADDRLQQAARAFTATESGGLLRGMGLASFTGLLGKKKGKAAEARLDDKIVSQLVSTPVGPTNLVSPTASLRGEPRGADAPAPGIIDVVQEAGRGKVKLHRQKIGATKGVFALGAYQAIRLSRLAARALPERVRVPDQLREEPTAELIAKALNRPPKQGQSTYPKP